MPTPTDPGFGFVDPAEYGDVMSLPVGQQIPYVNQLHLARKAGRHFDVRFGTDKTFSWATKKGLPQPGNPPVALFQTPLHNASYSNFQGKLKGYGAGTVSTHDKGHVIVTSVSPHHISFVTTHGKYPQRYTFVRDSKNPKTWLAINNTPASITNFLHKDIPKDKVSPEYLDLQKEHYKAVEADAIDKLTSPDATFSEKIDGASALYKLRKDRVDAISYRTDQNGRPIMYSEKIGLPGKLKIPAHLVGSTIKGEVWGAKPTEKNAAFIKWSEEEAIPSQELGGILNSTLANALRTIQERKIKMRNAFFKVRSYGTKVVGPDVPYSEHVKMLNEILQHLPKEQFHLPRMATTPEEQKKLWEDIVNKRNPRTHEGVVVFPKTGTPSKVKLFPESDVYMTGTFPGEGARANSVGGITYALQPGGPTAGKIGSGISDELLNELATNANDYIGRVARIKSQEQFPSGAHRAPSFISFHEDYPAVKTAAVKRDIQKQLVFTAGNGVKVFLVDGEAVRNNYYVDYTEGGHDLVYSWIPKKEIWIERVQSPLDRLMTIKHEFHERALMEKGQDYDTAHEATAKMERATREKLTGIQPTEKEKTAAADSSDLLNLLGIADGGHRWHVGKSKIHGKGVFASEPIPKGHRIFLSLSKVGNTGVVDKDYVRTRFGRYINHQNVPSSFLMKDGNKWHSVAAKDLQAGDEITSDYSLAPWELPAEKTAADLKNKDKKRPDKKYNILDLLRGKKIEHEHTTSDQAAETIAKDHLDEHKKYYDPKVGLPAMEKKLERIEKAAKITTELQPHQEEIVKKLQNNNVLAAHGLGSGKSLSSIAAMDSLKMPTTILTPASLVSNYQKEIDKHTTGKLPSYEIMSMPTAVARNHAIKPGFLIVDEAHGLRNVGTARLQYLKKQIGAAKRVLFLTGTPAYNNASDVAPIINLLKGETVLPENKTDFDKRYIDTKEVKPGFFGSLLGVKSGIVSSLKNVHELKKHMNGVTDVFQSNIEKPRRTDEDVMAEMSKQQQKVYDFVEGRLPMWAKWKIRMGLPPNKSEMSNFNSFLQGVRQASNSPGAYMADMTPIDAAKASPKIMRAVDEVVRRHKQDPNFRAFAYSNYLESGVNPMSALLKEHKIPHAVFHGGLNQKEKKQIVDDYNSGRIKMILGTSSASEGLDLKGTKLIQILEPHFNDSKIDQLIGRGIRYKSHAHLPVEERVVHVQRFYSTPKRGWFSIGPKQGVDQWLGNRAKEKDVLMKQLVQLMDKNKTAE